VVERSGKAECRESGTLRLAWEVGVVMLPSTPTSSTKVLFKVNYEY
jgi:hypothetical protein